MNNIVMKELKNKPLSTKRKKNPGRLCFKSCWVTSWNRETSPISGKESGLIGAGRKNIEFFGARFLALIGIHIFSFFRGCFWILHNRQNCFLLRNEIPYVGIFYSNAESGINSFLIPATEHPRPAVNTTKSV